MIHCQHLFKLKFKDGGVGKLRYPLLSDINKEVSRSYDVLLEDQGVALRGMFVIDKEGILRHITVNDLPIGRSVDEAIRIIQALQFTEEHGEGNNCYSNITKTMLCSYHMTLFFSNWIFLNL